MSIRRSVSGPAFVLTAGRMLAFGATFFIPVVLARVFSADEFGTYKQVFIFYDTLFYIAQVGLATSLFYFVPRSPEHAARFVANTSLVTGLIAAAAAIVVATRAEMVSWLFSNPRLEPLVTIGAIYFLLMMAAVPLEIVMVCRQKYRLASASYALSDMIRATALILPTLVTGDLRWMMLGAVTFASLRATTALLYFRGVYGGELGPDRHRLVDQLRYSLPFGLAVLVGTLQGNFHHFVVSHSFDAATFAIFAVGCLQIPLIDFIATPMADVMMVKMTEARRESHIARAKAIWHHAMSDLALLFVPLVGLLLVVGDLLIVLLYTDSYTASVPIFRVFILSILFTPLLIESVLRVHADTRYILLLNTLQLATVALLIHPFLDRFGLVGGVMVTLTAVVGVRAAGLWRVKRLLESSVRSLLPWTRLMRVAAIATAATAASVLTRWVVDAGPIPSLAAICSVHVLVWAGLSLRWGFLPKPGALSISAGLLWLRSLGTGSGETETPQQATSRARAVGVPQGRESGKQASASEQPRRSGRRLGISFRGREPQPDEEPTPDLEAARGR